MSRYNNEAAVRLTDVRPLRNLVRFLRLLWQAEPTSAAGLALVTLVAGLIPAGGLWALGRLVDSMALLFAGRRDQLEPLLALVALAALLLAASRWVQLLGDGLQDRLRDRVGLRLHHQLLTLAYQVEYGFFDHAGSYDDLQRAHGALGYRLVNLYQYVLMIAQGLVTGVSYVAAVASAHWLLGLAVGLATLPSLWWKVARARQMYIFDYETLTPTRRRLSYLYRLLTERSFAKEVRLFGLGAHLLGRWQAEQRRWSRESLAAVDQEFRAAALGDLVSAGVFAGVAFYLVQSVGGALSIGGYVMLVQAVVRLQEGAELLLRSVRDLYQDALFASNLFGVIDQPPAAVAAGTLPFPDPLRDGIRFEDVWFRYPGAPDWSLAGVSFHAAPGEAIALVGRNGAGKSTMVKLLLGLYRPERGRITFDGVPLEQIDPTDLRAHMTAIFQDFTRFELSLGESVGLGDPSRIGEAGRLAAAAHASGVDELAARLPRGFETLLSPAFGGVDLSGGEWQKVALARALTRQAPIMILDEPTAALDPRAERALFERFRQLATGRNAFLISHRIGTARFADRILVIRDGRIVEAGNHDELVGARGEYAELFALQAQWYTGGDRGA